MISKWLKVTVTLPSAKRIHFVMSDHTVTDMPHFYITARLNVVYLGKQSVAFNRPKSAKQSNVFAIIVAVQ